MFRTDDCSLKHRKQRLKPLTNQIPGTRPLDGFFAFPFVCYVIKEIADLKWRNRSTMFDPLFRAHPDWIRQSISHLLHIFDSARKADKTLVASAVQRHVTALDFAAETWLCFRCRVLGQIFNGSEVDVLICPDESKQKTYCSFCIIHIPTYTLYLRIATKSSN